LLSAIAIGIALGCSLETRTRLMHFFFEYPEAGQEGRAVGETAPAPPTRREPPRHVVSSHAPFVSRQCEGCHVADKGQMPREDFMRVCQECHATYFEYRRFEHAPVAAGDCRQCHVMHVSQHAALLLASQDKLCTSCHKASAVEGAQETYHRGIANVKCTACHDPHFGKTHFLLKPEDSRLPIPDKPEASRVSNAEP
jgi:predicted CXXCH cytochrome family protein